MLPEIAPENAPATTERQPAERSEPKPAGPATPTGDADRQPADVDARGVPFDPERHLPTRHPKTGAWMPRRKPASARTAATGAAPRPPTGGPAAEPAPDFSDVERAAAGPAGAPGAAAADRFDALADVYTRAAIAGAMGLLGDEWQPDDEAEFVALRNSAAAYLRATQKDDLPPGWALAFAALTYAGKRLPRPKTQGRLAALRERLAAWWRGHRVARAVASMPAPGGGA